MNRTDLFSSTVTEMIDPALLARFAVAVAAHGPIAAAPIILDARHEHVLTPRYELAPEHTGVISRSDNGSISEMTWIEIATHLARVATPVRALELSDAVDAHPRQSGLRADDRQVRALCDDYAHAAAVVAGLLDPVHTREADNGFDIELRSTSHRTTIYVNEVELAAIHPHRFTANVAVAPHTDPDTHADSAGFAAQIDFVPHGDSNTPTPLGAGQRVGIERLDPDSDDDAKWAIQIDGYDTVIVEALSELGVRIAVYDNDPTQQFLRFDKTFPIDPLPTPAEQRLARLSCRPMGRER